LKLQSWTSFVNLENPVQCPERIVTQTWLCCQLGAREHYAVPRALQLNGLLDQLVTDLWIRPGTLLHSWQKSLHGRFHRDLADAHISAPNLAALSFELKASLARENGWKLIGDRNAWFQRHAVSELARSQAIGRHTVFAYSYAAREIFEFARGRGWRTVLGQIDPGPAEEQIVASLDDIQTTHWKPAPPAYWDNWRAECALADKIIVNSNWSRDALLSQGVPAEKLHVVPLAYEPHSDSFQRHYPREFSAERPLRVLFLGQVNLRKGVKQLLDAVKLLRGEPIEFWFVGPTQIQVPAELKTDPQCKWFGVAPRLEVDKFYRDADVFILPTHSDGFGLTQLEAQSWKLPVIASRYCGDVVQHGVNGVILEEVSADAIAEVLRNLLPSPDDLSAMSSRSGVSERFSLTALGSSLAAL
jgi:glycosyltransferase involved in cell wall biosynthesis